MPLTLQASVGIGGKNIPSDIQSVQRNLNKLSDQIGLDSKLLVDGSLGSKPELSRTVAAIKLAQRKITKLGNPDGRIDVNGRTHRSINEALASLVTLNTENILPFAHKGKGKWGLRFEPAGTSGHPVYNQRVVLFEEDGDVLGVFQGSSAPNPFKSKDPSIKGTDAYPQIKKGFYKLNKGLHKGQPALVVNNNLNVPTTTLNPNYPEQGANARFIHVHWGQKSSWKGSAGCPTILPTEWKSFLSKVPDGEGILVIQ